MQQPQGITLPIIPENKQKINLSPFTWNQLTLSPFIKSNIKKTQDQLATITEAKHRNKNVIVPLNRRFSKQQNKNSKEKLINKSFVDKNTQQMQGSHKYNSKNKKNINEASKTIDFMNNVTKSQKIKIVDEKSVIQRYSKTSSLRHCWRKNKEIQNKELQIILHKIQSVSNHQKIKRGHFNNDIQGSDYLTLKGNLYEQMHKNGKQFYPLSFLIPKDLQAFIIQNNKIAVKSMLKQISHQIVQYFHAQNLKDNSWSETKVHIGDILQSSVMKTNNEHVSILLKMCMYMQIIRIQEKYNNYFQRFPSYFKINIKPKAHLFETLIKQSVNYLDQKPGQLLKINYRNIDFRLLVLILHYDALFKKNETTYDSPHQLWIIKSLTSSKGAEVTIVKSSSQFCQTQEYQIVQYKIRKKYENKIIQKYIATPYLLNNPPSFCNRKFDIHQWVLVVGGRTTFKIYKYNTAFCKFASQNYDSNKLSKGVHHTNYEKSKIQSNENNVMMIQQLFQNCHEDLRGKYAQQSVEIIKSVILNSKNLKCQQGNYSLFGFEFLIDSNGKLYLLKVKFNPEKSTSKHQKLKQQSKVMTQSMLQLVKNNKNTGEWIKVFGTEMQRQESQFVSSKKIEVKPFYKGILSQGQSLLYLVRQRKRIFFMITALIKKYQGRRFFKILKEQPTVINQDGESINIQSEGQIRFIQERQLSNI